MSTEDIKKSLEDAMGHVPDQSPEISDELRKKIWDQTGNRIYSAMLPPKPIVVVYLPENITDSGMRSSWDICGDLARSFEKDKADYYWFFFPHHELHTPEIKVFHIKDFTPIQYEELKKMIEEKIKPTP